MSGRNRPTIIGSTSYWWNWDDSCQWSAAWKVWTCDWRERNSIGYITMRLPLLSDGCDAAKFGSNSYGGCTDQYAPYTIGRMMQWGRGPSGHSYGIDVGPWSGIAGMTNTGWHWRSKAANYSVDGTCLLLPARALRCFRNCC